MEYLDVSACVKLVDLDRRGQEESDTKSAPALRPWNGDRQDCRAFIAPPVVNSFQFTGSREIPPYASRPIRRKRMGFFGLLHNSQSVPTDVRRKSACSARNDGVISGKVGVGAWPAVGLDWDRQALT